MNDQELLGFLAGVIERAHHYDETNSYYVSLANGTKLNQDLGFEARSVVVDNHTSAYLQFPDAGDGVLGRFVPPGQPAVIPLLRPNRIGRVIWAAPPGKTEPVAITTEQAQLVFFATATPVGQALASQSPILRWNVNAAPATGSQATVAFAASPGVTHIGDSCAGTLVSAGTSGTGGVSFRVKDGPNVITTLTYAIQSVAGALTQAGPFGPGLNLRGGLGNAMTVEFGSGLTNVAQSVNLNGFDQ